ncbi:hypothetical protein XV92_01660 [Vibrio metoecus]|uniref:N-acetyltransferase domain-containing protein n=1 Tax=Vibrio metoecus TaxID=1481663 RepID=A0A0Q0TRE3_VIBMT|nr:N-acetyltransferase [Vibrio metoecus]KQB03942.1 hypothetical protein XV92_01660 [Vibrio metoecus]
MVGNSLKIRKLKQRDIAKARLLIEKAFSDKFCSMTSLDREQLTSSLCMEKIIDVQLHEGHRVAELDGNVVGIISVKSWKSPKTKSLDLELVKTALSEYGFLGMLNVLLGLILLDESVAKGHYYIEHIAIDESYRGKGIGNELMTFAELTALSDPDATKLTLVVARSNVRAISFYEQRGYQVDYIEKSQISKAVLGIKHWLYMSKRFVKDNNTK